MSDTLKCEMTTDCTDQVAYLDESGFIYCADHGAQRQSWKRCRKLRPYELNGLRKGKPVKKY